MNTTCESYILKINNFMRLAVRQDVLAIETETERIENQIAEAIYFKFQSKENSLLKSDGYMPYYIKP